jgi:hypothetical protein
MSKKNLKTIKTSQLCTHLNKQRYCHFGVYKCMHTAGRSTMHGMSWSGFVTGAVDPACMMSLLLRAWWAARPEAASAGTPLGQDGRPSTCAISDPRRPPGTFDTPNHIVSSVSVGWWRSRGEVWLTPVDFETAYPKKLTRPGASSGAAPVKKIAILATVYPLNIHPNLVRFLFPWSG